MVTQFPALPLNFVSNTPGADPVEEEVVEAAEDVAVDLEAEETASAVEAVEVVAMADTEVEAAEEASVVAVVEVLEVRGVPIVTEEAEVIAEEADGSIRDRVAAVLADATDTIVTRVEGMAGQVVDMTAISRPQVLIRITGAEAQ